MDKRIIDKLLPGLKWERVEMKDLKEGDIIRLQDSIIEEGTYTDLLPTAQEYWKVKANPVLKPAPTKDGTPLYSIETQPCRLDGRELGIQDFDDLAY